MSPNEDSMVKLCRELENKELLAVLANLSDYLELSKDLEKSRNRSSAVTASDNDSEPRIILPPVQRGSVWRQKQIVELWDTVFRGMPIGSVLLLRPDRKNEDSRTNNDFELLDGQQRTLSLLPGRPRNPEPYDSMIWIDLSALKSGRNFLRTTTKERPFGFTKDHTKLSTEDIKAWRNFIIKIFNGDKKIDEACRFDEIWEKWYEGDEKRYPPPFFDELKAIKNIDIDSNSRIDDETVKRIEKKAADFVQLPAVWGAYLKYKEGGGCFSELLKDKCPLLGRRDSLDTESISLLFDKIGRVDAAKVPLVIIDKSSLDGFDSAQNNGSDKKNSVEVLFERIARGGTPTTPDELLFSKIKNRIDGAGKFVDEAIKEVGALMSPTDFVMTAFRIAASVDTKSEDRIPDLPRPSLSDFNKYLNKTDLSRYIGTEGGKTEFREALEQLNLVLTKRDEKDESDVTIPKALLAYFDRFSLQVVLRWIMGIPKEQRPELLDGSKNEIVSFLLYWHVHKNSHADKASVELFAKIAEIAKLGTTKKFPLRELHKLLTNPPLKNDKSEERKFEKFATLWPVDANTLQEDSVKNELFSSFFLFVKKKEMLLWFQAEYLNLVYKDANVFLSGRISDDTVPYDYDHIVPQDWGRLRNLEPETKTKLAKGNWIGNFHVLDSTANRSAQDVCFRKKRAQTEEYYARKKEKWNVGLSDINEFESKLVEELCDCDRSPKCCVKNSDFWEKNSGANVNNFDNAAKGRSIRLYQKYAETIQKCLTAAE